jgi:hypothetical protein
MPDVEIRATTITPDADRSIVRLQLSEAPQQAEYATMLLDVTVKLPGYIAPPLMARLQRQAIRAAMDIFARLTKAFFKKFGSNLTLTLSRR